MKPIEERIKDRLEGYESALPEGDFAEFKAMLGGQASVEPEGKAVNPAWLVPLIVVVGLALLVMLWDNPEPSVFNELGSTELVAGRSGLVAEVNVPSYEVISVEEISRPSDSPDQVRDIVFASSGNEEIPEDHTACVDGGESIGKERNAPESNYEQDASVPFGWSNDSMEKHTNANMKLGKAAAATLGGSGALALVAYASASKNEVGDYLNLQSTYYFYDSSNNTGLGNVDKRTGDDIHCLPLRVGLSMRFPFNDKWSFTTGLDYILYSSSIGYSISGDMKQKARYLEIPLLVDYSIIGDGRFEVYTGAGVAVDYCIAATLGGRKIKRDGFGFSLVGAGGIQLNVTEYLGLYINPMVSWNIPTKTEHLSTYKSEHPFIPTVSGGIRITLPNNK